MKNLNLKRLFKQLSEYVTVKLDIVAGFIVVVLFLSPYLVPLRISPVSGNSMYPTIHDGETVLVTIGLFDRTHIPNGTIIIYKANEDLYIQHRIVFVFPGYYICKGDNNPGPDPWPVTYDMVIGIYIAHFSGGR